MTTGEVIALIKAFGGGGGGSGGGVLVVTDTDGTLDKTAGEIMAAAETMAVIVKRVSTTPPMTSIALMVGFTSLGAIGYNFNTYDGQNAIQYNASSENDYPVINE